MRIERSAQTLPPPCIRRAKECGGTRRFGNRQQQVYIKLAERVQSSFSVLQSRNFSEATRVQ
jgi:hypothetical protein